MFIFSDNVGSSGRSATEEETSMSHHNHPTDQAPQSPDDNVTEHEHPHTHGDGTEHTHPHVHQAGQEEHHAHSH
jgi:hypothetical protein